MASVALDPAYRRVSVEEFLTMNFGEAKAELEDGLIYMMAGGSARHALIAGNIYVSLRTRLRGSGCTPYGSDLLVRTGEASARFPEVSVYCGSPTEPANDRKLLLGDPQCLFEVLSPSTSRHDQKIKLEEYRDLAGVREVVFVDPESERIRLVRRTGADGWADDWLVSGEDLHLSSLDLTIPHSEIFTRD